MANALIQNPVDRENHIVHGVKVLGFTSANGRIYDFAAVKEAIQKYEKAPVNKDHNMEEPSFSDRLGWLENVTLEKDGLYADFHYNPHADGIESFLWFAEHNGLGDVGFSHLVSGKYSVDPDGTERITRIDKVKSVDLVANPATTKTIFESEVKPMEKKVIEEATQDIGTGDSVQYRGGFGTIKNIKKFDKGTIYSIRNSRGSEDTLKIYDDENKNTHADWILKVKKIPNRKEKSPVDQGYDQRSVYNESDEPVVFGSSVTKSFYDKMKKLAASGSEEGKRQVRNIEDMIKKDEKERQIQKDLWAKHLKDKKSKSEQEDKPMGKKIAKEAGNAANKVKKNATDDRIGQSYDKKWGLNGKDSKSMGRQIRNQTDPGIHWDKLNKVARGEQEDDDVEEADSDEREFEMAVDSLDRLLMKDKISQKDYDKKYDELSKKMKDKKRYPVKPEQEDDDVGEASNIGTEADYKNMNDRFDKRVKFLSSKGYKQGNGKFAGYFFNSPKRIGIKSPLDSFGGLIDWMGISNSDIMNMDDSTWKNNGWKYATTFTGEQEGDDEMDKEKLMEEENPMQQEEAEQDPMMEEADDVYAKVKEVCEGEGSDEEKSKQVLEMLGLSGGMSEAEDDEEMKEDDDEETKEQDSEVLENDDEEMKEDDDEDPRKESKSELKSLRKWKSEKLKQEKIVNLIKESNLEPTKVFVKQLSAIDSKLWGEAIRDRRKVALTRAAVKPISSGSQSRSESSYKQFLESVLGK